MMYLFKNNNIYQRDYFNFKEELFRDDASIQKWENNFTDVNAQFNDFYWRLESCVDRHAPIKKLNRKELKIKSKPWITPDIIRLIKQRDIANRRKKQQPNNENLKLLYNKFRNRVNKELKKIKEILLYGLF